MDVIAFGAKNTEIAAGCKGSSVDGSCLFDEFINKIRQIPNGGSPRFRTNIGANLLPDPQDAATQLRNAGFSGNTDRNRLLPGAWEGTDRGFNPTFSQLFDKIEAAIKACRDEVGDEPLAAQLLGARDSMAYNQEARVADQSESTVKALNKYLQENGYSWVCTTEMEHFI